MSIGRFRNKQNSTPKSTKSRKKWKKKEGKKCGAEKMKEYKGKVQGTRKCLNKRKD